MPTRASEDGIDLSRFLPGFEYEVGNSTGSLFLAERWAVPVDAAGPVTPVLPFRLGVIEPGRIPAIPRAVELAGDGVGADPAIHRERTRR